MPQGRSFNNVIFIILLLPWFFESTSVLCRSVLREENIKNPLLEAKLASKKSSSCYLRDWKLEEGPIFKSFDKVLFNNNLIPEQITYKYDTSKHVSKKKT